MCLAIPGKLVETHDEARRGYPSGTVDFGGVAKEICLAYTPDARPGDYVLVHAGFSLNVIDEEEAARVFDALRLLEPDEIP
ncbi:MAG: HypC/HybG/HupF family hydrogenase formation chaperone [Bryobacterales bacterium]|nr:HypC/HybG/HupF family hydrogenase formation chaperone [Bryobacterales bacterium]